MGAPIDRSAKTAMDANLVNGTTSNGPLLKSSDNVIYDYVDGLNSAQDAHAAAATLAHPDGSVKTAKIADGAVTTAKLADGSVTFPKLAISAQVNESVNNALIVALKAETATLNINLAHYADFGNLAENYDITTIIQSAMADLATKVVGTTGWKLFKVSIFIPGGHWKVTQKRVFDLSSYGISAVRGFNIYGAGFENTQITFDHNVADTDNYLIYNDDTYGYSEIKNIRFISANGTENCIYQNTNAASNTQSLIFDGVTWYGFKKAIYYGGTIGDSEMDYYSCKIIATPAGGYGIHVNNRNSVNHNFYACEFESIIGYGIYFQAGGCANFYGGSYITADGGTIFYTTDNSGADIGTSNNTFNFYGIRTEVNGTSKIFDVQSYVQLMFDGCNLTVERSNVGSIRGTLGPFNSSVHFVNCSNKYFYQINTNNTAYSNGQSRVRFLNCRLFTQLDLLVTLSAGISNIAGYPSVIAEGTIYPTTGATQRPIIDNDVFKEDSGLTDIHRVKTVFLRTGADGNGGLPANAGTTYQLPLNAIITKIRIVHRVSTLTGNMAYDVKDYTGTITFASLGSTAYNVEATAISADLWYRIDTDAKRTISLLQTGTNSTQRGYIVVDYI